MSVRADTESAQASENELPSPWTPAVIELLRDWANRAAASSETHYAVAGRLSSRNVQFGVPVVALTSLVGTSVFATLQHNVQLGIRVGVGAASVLAAVLASLQTFLRFAERAEKHRAAAESWAAVRREIAEMVALHPTYLASRGDPKQYLDDVRRRMDEISAQSPEMGDSAWTKAQTRYGLTYKATETPPQGGAPSDTEPTVAPTPQDL
jgi:SMODS and SLOG-associating 2TM effector domain family 4